MGKKRQNIAREAEHDDVEETHADAPATTDAAEPTTPREQTTTVAAAAAAAPAIEGGERASNASDTPHEAELPATPTKEKSPRVAYTVDEMALERNKIFQFAVFVLTLVVSAVLYVYNHARVKPHVDAAVKRGTDFAAQVNKKYSVTLRASDLYNVALEELEEYAAWRQIVEPRLRQAVTVAGHVQSRVARYFQ